MLLCRKLKAHIQSAVEEELQNVKYASLSFCEWMKYNNLKLQETKEKLHDKQIAFWKASY